MIINNIELDFDKKAYIMGILNNTPDSFSDGGQFQNMGAIKKRVREVVENHGTFIDIGGESTRPGSKNVPIEEEFNRIKDSIFYSKQFNDLIISVDTSKSYVAHKALAAGAHIINDVTGLRGSSDMRSTIAHYDAHCILMANRRYAPVLGDPFKDIVGLLEESLEISIRGNIDQKKIILDPGIGFNLSVEENFQILNRLGEIKNYFNMPLLLGTSRKSFLYKTLNVEPQKAISGTLGTTALGLAMGARIFRVHDIKENYECLKICEKIVLEGRKNG